MNCCHDDQCNAGAKICDSRREFLQLAIATIATWGLPHEAIGALSRRSATLEHDKLFPYFKSTPISYFDVRMKDTFWSPRQERLLTTSVPWASRHYDESGGLEAFRLRPAGYMTKVHRGDLEAIKFIESMAAVLGLQRDLSVEGMMKAWRQKLIADQDRDGYWYFGWPAATDPTKRWRAVWWSHEDYAIGHYLESAIGIRESIGDTTMYDSAVRAVDNMAATFLGSERGYAPGHQEIEQALMRLYGLTGDTKYLQLCGWFIEQRGNHESRGSYGAYSQDHIPVRDQRTIEGHAVRAAYLFNGVTEYVGATGDSGYRDAVIAVWDDLVNHKMYLHGAGGVMSAKNEGYVAKPDVIPPNDAYGESCSVCGNVQWAHNLFRLTGEASYLDVAERMLYNAFYAALSLNGDRFFYHNVAQKDEPVERFEWHRVACCPPNIIKMFAKVGGLFYSIGRSSIFVNHYGSSEARIPLRNGVALRQITDYPWSGDVDIGVEPNEPTEFDLCMRIPSWAKSHAIAVNGVEVNTKVVRGWVAVKRRWKAGDRVELRLPMQIERVTMPSRFKEYRDLVALQRGPIVYCLEQKDAALPISSLYLPSDASLKAEYKPELLGGITVITGMLPRTINRDQSPVVPVTFIPYGFWNNRGSDTMRMWLRVNAITDEEIETRLATPPTL